MTDWGLDEKVVLITGAGRGIGQRAAELFLEAGCRVVVADLDTSAEIAGEGERLRKVEADLSSAEGCGEAVRFAVEEFGGVDVLINNLGIAPERTSILDVTDEQWLRTISINFMCMLRVSRGVVPSMIERGGGSIVSLASTAARHVDPGMIDYSVTKAMVLNLSKGLANEFGSKGIRSNVISPGPTWTPAWEEPGGLADGLAAKLGVDRDEVIDYWVKEVRKIPSGRMGTPDDVGAVLLFLASPLASQVTGSDYRVDGGAVFHV